nr:hypothetical protein [uncultured Kingella sp.]
MPTLQTPTPHCPSIKHNANHANHPAKPFSGCPNNKRQPETRFIRFQAAFISQNHSIIITPSSSS